MNGQVFAPAKLALSQSMAVVATGAGTRYPWGKRRSGVYQTP